MANTKPKSHGPAAKYINADSRDYLARCFPGLIPAVVIAEALREKAVREGRLTPTRHGRRPAGPRTGTRPRTT
jgi:hypothetical protein